MDERRSEMGRQRHGNRGDHQPSGGQHGGDAGQRGRLVGGPRREQDRTCKKQFHHTDEQVGVGDDGEDLHQRGRGKKHREKQDQRDLAQGQGWNRSLFGTGRGKHRSRASS